MLIKIPAPVWEVKRPTANAATQNNNWVETKGKGEITSQENCQEHTPDTSVLKFKSLVSRKTRSQNNYEQLSVESSFYDEIPKHSFFNQHFNTVSKTSS
jgi:hypothetical protein